MFMFLFNLFKFFKISCYFLFSKLVRLFYFSLSKFMIIFSFLLENEIEKRLIFLTFQNYIFLVLK